MSGFAVAQRRRTPRYEINPLDKSTLISIFPKDIHEVKHTIQPPEYHIPAGSPQKPSLVVVGSASWWREIDPEQPLLEVPVSSVQVADSIVTDYCNGLLGCDMNTRKPGLTFVPGEQTLDKIKRDYPNLILGLIEKQNAWYNALVKLADAMWSRTNGNPLAIADLQRTAALELGMKDKPWIKDFAYQALVACAACGNMRNPQFPICPHCKAIVDPERAKELKLTFAQ